MSNNKVSPCAGCEEVCDRIETNLRSYMRCMNWEQTKTDVWAFWRTLCSFMRRENDVAILENMYDSYMCDSNKKAISKKDFADYMTCSPL